MITAKTISPQITNWFDYETFKALVNANASIGETSGGEKTSERVEATKINAVRMNRIDKQITLQENTVKTLSKIRAQWTWTIIAETWCGDGAQTIPIIAQMAAQNPNITLQIILRDENPEVMNAYLTNGSRSIPKLICTDTKTKQELGTWGPRPTQIQEQARLFKEENPMAPHEEFVKNLHLVYARDKGESVQLEFTQLIEKWTRQ